MREARLAADVEKVIVACENERESLRGAILAAAVEGVFDAHDNKSESLRETKLAADVERVFVAVRMKVNLCVKRDKRLI